MMWGEENLGGWWRGFVSDKNGFRDLEYLKRGLSFRSVRLVFDDSGCMLHTISRWPCGHREILLFETGVYVLEDVEEVGDRVTEYLVQDILMKPKPNGGKGPLAPMFGSGPLGGSNLALVRARYCLGVLVRRRHGAA